MKIGLAVGIPLTAVVFGAVAILVFWRERRWKKEMQEMRAHGIPSSYGASYGATKYPPNSTSQDMSTSRTDHSGMTPEDRLSNFTAQPNPRTVNELSYELANSARS